MKYQVLFSLKSNENYSILSSGLLRHILKPGMDCNAMDIILSAVHWLQFVSKARDSTFSRRIYCFRGASSFSVQNHPKINGM